ncbi:MAG: hypothetical protein Q9221_000334 [Calogaya cf. arnoldii]
MHLTTILFASIATLALATSHPIINIAGPLITGDNDPQALEYQTTAASTEHPHPTSTLAHWIEPTTQPSPLKRRAEEDDKNPAEVVVIVKPKPKDGGEDGKDGKDEEDAEAEWEDEEDEREAEEDDGEDEEAKGADAEDYKGPIPKAKDGECKVG